MWGIVTQNITRNMTFIFCNAVKVATKHIHTKYIQYKRKITYEGEHLHKRAGFEVEPMPLPFTLKLYRNFWTNSVGPEL